MKGKWERRDILLFLIFVMLVINFLSGINIVKLDAETFKLDSCITARINDKPEAYLHVASH